MFTSPTLGTDTAYELVEDDSMPDGLAVRCVETKETFGTDVLSKPTLAQLSEQHNSFVREICSWLVANNPSDEQRKITAVSEVRRMTGLDYTAEDLADDVEWIRTHGLEARVHAIATYLDEARRGRLLQLAATVGSSSALGETDARFVEVLGQGLGFDGDAVMQIVMSAVNNTGLAAA